MTDEEPKSPDIMEIVHQGNLDPWKHLPSWLPYELDKETGGYRLDAKPGEPAIKKLNRVEKLFRNTVTKVEQLRERWQSRRRGSILECIKIMELKSNLNEHRTKVLGFRWQSPRSLD